ncbi:Toluene efflux pump outer membrane protein TtgF [Polaromonas vacuolata]|uniref:Toluene efflux pump outer membrane protein TtgF n=2 Tax=Polaromonas vacuolata TaxID=37448 RepID=A0A6H2HAV1_9BURK|nr:Toluene efflux pump outer membrane protein TtgF [Polaromonas vacuolata]
MNNMPSNPQLLTTVGTSPAAPYQADQALPIWRASSRMALVTLASLLAVGIMATGCADMSGIHSSADLRNADSLGLSASAPEQALKNMPVEKWWTDFGDAQLDALVAKALENNPNLKLAQARLKRAQSSIESVAAAAGPQLQAQLDVTRQRYSANGLVPPPLAGSTVNNATAQLSASWELDFFGKNRAALDAAIGTANASAADAQAARVLLASNVARSYFQLLRLNDLAAVAKRTLAQRQETLKLVQDRVGAGLDTRLELRQSEGGLPEARLQLEVVLEQAALTRNALAALTGQSEAQVSALLQELPALTAIHPVALQAKLSADLLGRRADIAAARWRVEASSSLVANAKAEFYPNINLVGFAGFSSLGLNRLFSAGSQQIGVGPALRLPIFDSGRLRANLRGKTADLDIAVESYNAAVIDAVRDVSDQLSSLTAIERQQQQQSLAQSAAQDAYDIAVQRYKAGLGNFINVLTAETSVLTQRRLAVDLSARVLDTQVALIRALGGGYSASAQASFSNSAVLAGNRVIETSARAQ